MFTSKLWGMTYEKYRVWFGFTINKVAQLFFDNGYMPTNNDIVTIMKKCSLYNIGSDSTYLRRASTIKGWVNWIAKQIDV